MISRPHLLHHEGDHPMLATGVHAGARLDRLPIGPFHRRMLWLVSWVCSSIRSTTHCRVPSWRRCSTVAGPHLS